MLVALLLFLAAAVILGFRIISAVPPLLHTPLMSGMNALSGIAVLGALTVFAVSTSGPARWLGGAALVLAMINVAGGFWVTERMLRMFKEEKNKRGQRSELPDAGRGGQCCGAVPKKIKGDKGANCQSHDC